MHLFGNGTNTKNQLAPPLEVWAADKQTRAGVKKGSLTGFIEKNLGMASDSADP